MGQLQMICLIFLSLRNAFGELCTEDICEYTFVIRRWRTMTYNNGSVTFDVALNGTKLEVIENGYHLKENNPTIGNFVDVSDVITADGYQREVITINDMFPGPTIEVMEGKQVVVHVKNELILETTTIHWHGLHMTETPWMDGAAYVTQCPIQPNQVFTYRFQANPAGTHWYHSHIHGQRVDGLFGMIIIHDHPPALPEFVVTVTDWVHEDIFTIDAQHPYNKYKPGPGNMILDVSLKDFSVDGSELSGLKFDSALINGRGRWNDLPFPLSEFQVTNGSRYRFRVANTAAEYSFEISVDDHMIDVVASDGNEMLPIKVDSFMLHPGETMDFEMEADQGIDKYWMRSDTLKHGTESIHQSTKAIITYVGATNAGDPTTNANLCSQQNPCQIFNCPFLYPRQLNKNCIGLNNARSMLNQEYLDREYGLTASESDIEEYFLNFAFPIGSSINARKHMEPRAPFSQDVSNQYITPCDQDICDENGCVCTHIQNLPYNKTIQLVLMSYTPGADYMAHHIVHLHGHSFAVLAMGLPEQNSSTGLWTRQNQDILCSGSNPHLCTKARWNGATPILNKESPPIKDSIIIPARGYVVVRFRSLNPGYWMFHCHQELHMIEGMTMIFNEAEDKQKPIPKNFPSCSDFTWTEDDYEDYLYMSSETTKSPGTPAHKSTSSLPPPAEDNQDNEMDSGLRQDVLIINVSTAIGISFGFIALGAFIAIIMAIIMICCKRTEK